MVIADAGLAAAAAPKTPVKTRPLGELQRSTWFDGPDVVTALRVLDEDLECSLPHGPAFTLGASRRCDVTIPGRDLSALHCAFVRKGRALRVHDEDSTNGMYFGGR